MFTALMIFTSLAANGPSMTGATKSLVGTGAIKIVKTIKKLAILLLKITSQMKF